MSQAVKGSTRDHTARCGMGAGDSGSSLHARRSHHNPPSAVSEAGRAVGRHDALGAAAPQAHQADAQHGEEQAGGQFHAGDQPHVAEGREHRGKVIEGDHRQQRGGQQDDQPRMVAGAEDQVREPVAGQGDGGRGGQRQGGADDARPPQKAAQMPLLPVALDVASEGARQRQHRQRGGEHEEAEGHVPLPQLPGVEPAAEEDFAQEAHQPLQYGQCQEDEDAAHQRVGGQRAGRLQGSRTVEGDGMDEVLGVFAMHGDRGTGDLGI